MYYMRYRVGTMYQESYNIIYSDYLRILDFCYCGDYYKTQKLEIVYKLCNESRGKILSVAYYTIHLRGR